ADRNPDGGDLAAAETDSLGAADDAAGVSDCGLVVGEAEDPEVGCGREACRRRSRAPRLLDPRGWSIPPRALHRRTESRKMNTKYENEFRRAATDYVEKVANKEFAHQAADIAFDT